MQTTARKDRRLESKSSKLQSHWNSGSAALGRGGFALNFKACEVEAWQLLCWPRLMGE